MFKPWYKKRLYNTIIPLTIAVIIYLLLMPADGGGIG
jgi:hypothetical protein